MTPPTQRVPPRFSVAPMMDCTDRHFRRLVRCFSRHTWLYTEMVTMGAVLRGDRGALLDFDALEHPLSLQLGGDDADGLAACAEIAAQWGYDEVNLNVGCPSPRVRAGNFGACLMLDPERVATIVAAMRRASGLEVTVKHRLGVDEADRYTDVRRFVDVVAQGGCRRFIVHARKALLSGLSPAENRTVPPLRWADVHRLQAERPDLAFELNGGVRSLAQARAQLGDLAGVMVGRAFFDDPLAFADVDREWFGAAEPAPGPQAVLEEMARYGEGWEAAGGRAREVLRRCLHLLTGRPGARAFRRALGEALVAGTPSAMALRGAWEAACRGGRGGTAAA